jgi:hypothetical protein
MEEREIPRDLFHAEERRARSPEWDFGVHWRGEADWPRYRVSWIVETGELYAEAPRQPLAPSNVLLLAVVEKVGEYPYGDHEAWREFNQAQPVERIMDGWAYAETLDWIRDRLSAVVAS